MPEYPRRPDGSIDVGRQRREAWDRNNGQKDTPAVPQHIEYPKHMTHPAFKPATVGAEVTDKSGFKYHTGGTPIVMPPVLVHNEDQEAYYAARGYVSQGKSDPAAFTRAHAIPVAAGNFVPEQYPKWVDGWAAPVNNAEEEISALGAIEAGLNAPRPPAAAPPEKTPEQVEIEALKARIEALMLELREPEKPPAPEAAAPGKKGVPTKPPAAADASQAA